MNDEQALICCLLVVLASFLIFALVRYVDKNNPFRHLENVDDYRDECRRSSMRDFK